MAKKGFDRNEVLDNAITLFWQNGYTASSMQQITQSTGLKPGSLYNEFGNKEGLFLASLDRYSERSLQNARATIEEADSVKAGIRHVLLKLVQDTSNHNYCGCFLIKTQLELAAQNNDLYKFASEKLTKTEEMYAHYLGSLYDQETADQYAKQVMMVVYGTRVYGYQQINEAELERTAKQILPWLYQ